VRATAGRPLWLPGADVPAHLDGRCVAAEAQQQKTVQQSPQQLRTLRSRIRAANPAFQGCLRACSVPLCGKQAGPDPSHPAVCLCAAWLATSASTPW
jgi:hypothetical protein